MERAERQPECAHGSEETQMPLISGLPNDIARICLARVPRCYHSLLKCVSRGWRDLVCSEEWCNYRRKCNLDESWIYALCLDKYNFICLYVLKPNSTGRSWKKVHEYAPCSRWGEGMGFAAVGKRLYVLGGCFWWREVSNYCYDTSMNTWLEVSPHSTGRCYFACEVLDGKIYAIGGLVMQQSVCAPESWDTYDPSKDTWKCSSDPNIVPEIEDSFVMDGKIHIRSRLPFTTSAVEGAVYEPSTGMWQRLEDDMASGWRGPAIVVADNLYVLDQRFGATLMMWCKETRVWVRLGKLSRFVINPPCWLVTDGKSIFVVGKDCSSVVIDVERVKNMMNGIMVSSSIPKVSDDDVYVISCKCAAV